MNQDTQYDGFEDNSERFEKFKHHDKKDKKRRNKMNKPVRGDRDRKRDFYSY